MIRIDTPDYSDIPSKNERKYLSKMDIDQSKISIVTPFFNGSKLFEETISTVLNQSFQNFEWIVVNDKSNDETSLKLLDELASRDKRVRVLTHQANSGPGVARNTGFMAAESEFVLQLDCDDLLEPTAAEKWLWYLLDHPEYSWVGSFHVGFGAEQYIWSKSFNEGEVMLNENVVQPTCMIRKSAFKQIGGYCTTNRDGLEDWDFWLKAASQGYWGGHIPEHLFWYRRRKTHSDRWSNWTANGVAELKEQWRERYPDLYAGNFPKPIRNVDAPDFDVPANFLSLCNDEKILVIEGKFGSISSGGRTVLDEANATGAHITLIGLCDETPEQISNAYLKTLDVFSLPKFLRAEHYEKFIDYIVKSRGITKVYISQEELSHKWVGDIDCFRRVEKI